MLLRKTRLQGNKPETVWLGKLHPYRVIELCALCFNVSLYSSYTLTELSSCVPSVSMCLFIQATPLPRYRAVCPLFQCVCLFASSLLSYTWFLSCAYLTVKGNKIRKYHVSVMSVGWPYCRKGDEDVSARCGRLTPCLSTLVVGLSQTKFACLALGLGSIAAPLTFYLVDIYCFRSSPPPHKHL